MTEPIKARLAALPEPELPPDLWLRVRGARLHQRDRRRRIVAGSMAMLALVALPLFYLRTAAPPTPASSPAPAAFAAAPRAPLHEEPLRSVDRELQHAYERGASEQELQWLWQRREALARSGTATAVPQPIEI